MEITSLQQQLFQLIKVRLPADASAAEEVARLLNISADSAYRRIRGEKQLTFEEVVTLCAHFKISLDQLADIHAGGFVFQGNLLNEKTHRYDAYLSGMHSLISYFASTTKKEYYYLSKDTPIFHHWQCREYAAFKYFFVMSILIYFPEFRNRKVTWAEYDDKLWGIGRSILGVYNQMDSFELWNLDSISSTLHQIEYYREAGMFHSDHDALKVYEAVGRMLDHVEEQAALGYKFDIDDPLKKPMGKYQMYINDIIIFDNSMLVVQDNAKMALIPHTVINYMMTRDITFCDHLNHYIENIMRRSTLISETSEKERGRFFRILRERIARRKEKLNV